jgi:hypothetical protein
MTTRFNISCTTHSSIQRRFDNAIALAMELRRIVSAQLLGPDGFRSLELALEAIPIDVDQHAWLSTHVRNARDYLDQQECDAAAYELTLLVNRLRTQASLLSE